MLTTIHNDDVVAVQRRSRFAPSGRKEVEKPLAISEYSKYMGGVDRGDQLLSYYGLAFLWRIVVNRIRLVFIRAIFSELHGYANATSRPQLDEHRQIAQCNKTAMSVAKEKEQGER